MTRPPFLYEFVDFVQQIFSTKDAIPLHVPRFEGNERDYILETIESTFVSTAGEYVEKFEEQVSEFTGVRFVIATNNGTAALHTALRFSDVQIGDEVITQPLTFVATCNAICYCGANPVFVDVERSTLGLSPNSLMEFLEENAEIRDDGLCWNHATNRIIRACIPVHNLGHPARTSDILAICQQYNIALIEDAAESLGSFSEGVHTGQSGLMGILSFNGNKVITTGGGGAVMTNDETIARSVRHSTATAKQPHPWLFLHDEVGYNYRLPNLNAALGCAQMEQLPGYIERKRKLAQSYRKWFDGKDPEFVLEPQGARSNYWLNAILLDDKEERDSFLQYTNDHGIMTRPMWTPMHTLPMFRSCKKGDLTTAEIIEARLVSIPSSVI